MYLPKLKPHNIINTVHTLNLAGQLFHTPAGETGMLHNISWGSPLDFSDPGALAMDDAAGSTYTAGNLSTSMVVIGLEDIDTSMPTPEGQVQLVRCVDTRAIALFGAPAAPHERDDLQRFKLVSFN